MSADSVVRYVDEPSLRILAEQASRAGADQRLDARLELYEQVPSSGGASRKVEQLLTAALCEVYSEAYGRVLSFTKRPDVGGVVNYVNQTLGAAVERRNSQLMSNWWRAVRSVLTTSNSEVYELNDDINGKPCLWQFAFLWFDKSTHRVLVVTCRARSRAVCIAGLESSDSSSESFSNAHSVHSSFGSDRDNSDHDSSAF